MALLEDVLNFLTTTKTLFVFLLTIVLLFYCSIVSIFQWCIVYHCIGHDRTTVGGHVVSNDLFIARAQSGSVRQ